MSRKSFTLPALSPLISWNMLRPMTYDMKMIAASEGSENIFRRRNIQTNSMSI
ncbi:hypothetical protein HAX54_051978, partial [Datura stramonium]|nr:hypothetical protein [Datura stramonium]